MNLYTSSRLRVLRQCLRLHYYRYTLGITQPSGDAARFGTVGHAALEAWLRAWQAGNLDERLPAAFAAISASDLSPYDKARLSALITAYHIRWKDEPWEILAVEVEFRYELGDYTIGGKLDALIRKDGRVYVLEHKTTGQDASPGSAYWDRLSIDTQVSIYVDGATMLGHEIAGCIYDVLQRPRHEPKLATPEHERKYTQGMGCKLCGGGKGKQGSGVIGASVCAPCHGDGWRRDESGAPESPRLYANQRAEDETLDAYSERMIEEIAAEPDAYLIRGEVVRLEDELPRMRQDLIDAIKLERAAALFDLHPRNPDACTKFGSLCSMFDACAGRADVEDLQRFPRGGAHPELAAAA
jgi:PD-(D/E)XK nuclease superfamily